MLKPDQMTVSELAALNLNKLEPREIRVLANELQKRSLLLEEERKNLRDQVGSQYARINELERDKNREVSFYWRVVSRIGGALGIMPASSNSMASADAEWREYSKTIQEHVERNKAVPA